MAGGRLRRRVLVGRVSRGKPATAYDWLVQGTLVVCVVLGRKERPPLLSPLDLSLNRSTRWKLFGCKECSAAELSLPCHLLKILRTRPSTSPPHRRLLVSSVPSASPSITRACSTTTTNTNILYRHCAHASARSIRARRLDQSGRPSTAWQRQIWQPRGSARTLRADAA